MISKTKDKRAWLRGEIAFQVNLELVSPEDFSRLRSVQAVNSAGADAESLAMNDERSEADDLQLDPALIDFLVQMDDKLERILSLLSYSKGEGDHRLQARAMDISASGMRVCLGAPLTKGQIVHAKFFLSKFPLTFVDVYGEVVWVQEIMQNGPPAYQAGIGFLDLTALQRERIVNFVFKNHRRALRQRHAGGRG